MAKSEAKPLMALLSNVVYSFDSLTINIQSLFTQPNQAPEIKELFDSLVQTEIQLLEDVRDGIQMMMVQLTTNGNKELAEPLTEMVERIQGLLDKIRGPVGTF